MKTITVALNVRLPNCYQFARAMALGTVCTAALAADPPEPKSPPPDQGASVPAEAADAAPVNRKKARHTKQSKPGDPASGGTAPSKNAAAKAGPLKPGQDAPQPIEEPVSLETVEVIGRETDLLGVAESASQGVVGQNQFKFRPLLRVGELVEVVPGMIATQHSGSGKANQYFLRGFNLDHGTDFAVWLDGMPMNLPTNAHGQGYLDLISRRPGSRRCTRCGSCRNPS